MGLLTSLGGKLLGLLPLNQIADIVMASGLGKSILGPLVKVYEKTHGVRTQGLLVVAAVLLLASMLGWLPWDIATPLIKDLLIASGVTMADKLVRLLPAAQKAQEAVDAASKGA